MPGSLLLLVAPMLLHGQAPEQKPLAFEVASSKPNASGTTAMRLFTSIELGVIEPRQLSDHR